MKKLSLLLFLCTPLLHAQTVQLPDRGLCAHRGCMDTHPENTFPAFKEAIRLGAQMIEFDLQLTKDSVLVIMHDATVDRTTDGSGKIAEMTLQEIRKLDAGIKKGPEFKGAPVPTFEEVLDIMPINVWLNCHLKGTDYEGGLAATILKEKGRLHQAFITCSELAAKGAREKVPNIKICNAEGRYRSDTPRYVEETIKMKADFIQLLRTKVEEDRSPLVKQLKNNGVKINLFYAATPEELPELYQLGIDFPLVNDLAAFMPTAIKLGVKPVEPIFKE